MVLLVVEEDWRGWPRERERRNVRGGVGGIRTHYLKVVVSEEAGGGGGAMLAGKTQSGRRRVLGFKVKIGEGRNTLFSPSPLPLFSPPISLLSLLPSASPPCFERQEENEGLLLPHRRRHIKRKRICRLLLNSVHFAAKLSCTFYSLFFDRQRW